MNAHHCSHCGKTLVNLHNARFYFEDDSWLCDDCFGVKDFAAEFSQEDPAGETGNVMPSDTSPAT
jgi:recombinational DNA repair protein (RecF pathway)